MTCQLPLNECGEPATGYRWNWLSLRNNRLKFIKISGNLAIVVEESMGIYLKLAKENRKIRSQHVNRLDLGSTRISTHRLCPKNLPGHCLFLLQIIKVTILIGSVDFLNKALGACFVVNQFEPTSFQPVAVHEQDIQCLIH